eukprot:c2908_g1_i2.p1 GENE.c2908_g1_i2~~c2908_g1_i2.p1  ORF type:complete len:117 (-),score=13.27 c2908_g1_i2:95-394(-)
MNGRKDSAHIVCTHTPTHSHPMSQNPIHTPIRNMMTLQLLANSTQTMQHYGSKTVLLSLVSLLLPMEFEHPTHFKRSSPRWQSFETNDSTCLASQVSIT